MIGPYNKSYKIWIIQNSQKEKKITINNAFSPNCQVSFDLIPVMVYNGFSRQPETSLVNTRDIPLERAFIRT